MATQRQKKVARELIENLKRDKPLNGGKILEKTGYSKGVVKNPKDIIESDGVKQELRDLGFTIEGADAVLNEILYDKKTKPDTKIRAVDLMYKRLGANAPTKGEVKLQMKPILGYNAIQDELLQNDSDKQDTETTEED